jgi:uncharacterized membrane protein YadS
VRHSAKRLIPVVCLPKIGILINLILILHIIQKNYNKNASNINGFSELRKPLKKVVPYLIVYFIKPIYAQLPNF